MIDYLKVFEDRMAGRRFGPEEEKLAHDGVN
jgi:hypothetical protein